MKIEIDASSLIKAQKHMKNRADKVVKMIDTILKKSLFLVERYAKIEAPVRTGRLRASIGGGSFAGGSFMEGEGREFGRNFASIMPTVVYAKYVHRSNPFMRRGVEEAVPEIKRMVESEVKEAIK